MSCKFAMILAGGAGTRLSILSYERAKPAVPFGGIYRIIDFTLSNAMYSGVEKIGILTQYRPSSLMDHISLGEFWDFIGRNKEAKILPPFKGKKASDWYKGTADAVYQNINYIRRHKSPTVLILSGDHIYNMDYRKMAKFHFENDAHLTIATMEVPIEEASRFGVCLTDRKSRIIDFYEKPKKPPSNLVSLGIYFFNSDVLIDALIEDAEDPDSSHDFGKDVIPKLIKSKRVFAYKFKGYWRDVGTVESYQEANFDLLFPKALILKKEFKVRTNLRYRNIIESPPAKIHNYADVKNSIISPGCQIKGKVVHSILGPSVVVEKGAYVKDSILMHEVKVGRYCEIVNTIIDKDVIIEDNCKIGENVKHKRRYNFSGITLIGKGCYIREGMEIEPGVLIYPKI